MKSLFKSKPKIPVSTAPVVDEKAPPAQEVGQPAVAFSVLKDGKLLPFQGQILGAEGEAENQVLHVEQRLEGVDGLAKGPHALSQEVIGDTFRTEEEERQFVLQLRTAKTHGLPVELTDYSLAASGRVSSVQGFVLEVTEGQGPGRTRFTLQVESPSVGINPQRRVEMHSAAVDVRSLKAFTLQPQELTSEHQKFVSELQRHIQAPKPPYISFRFKEKGVVGFAHGIPTELVLGADGQYRVILTGLTWHADMATSDQKFLHVPLGLLDAEPGLLVQPRRPSGEKPSAREVAQAQEILEKAQTNQQGVFLVQENAPSKERGRVSDPFHVFSQGWVKSVTPHPDQQGLTVLLELEDGSTLELGKNAPLFFGTLQTFKVERKLGERGSQNLALLEQAQAAAKSIRYTTTTFKVMAPKEVHTVSGKVERIHMGVSGRVYVTLVPNAENKKPIQVELSQAFGRFEVLE